MGRTDAVLQWVLSITPQLAGHREHRIGPHAEGFVAVIAQLPMYMHASNLAAHRALWALIRDGLRTRGRPAPTQLDTTCAHDALWTRPDLCLTQICNLPLRSGIWRAVTPIGACDYGLPGCAPGFYRSVFVVRVDHPARCPEDLEGLTMAYNDPLSHSGWGAPWTWAVRHGMRFVPALRTGAHIGALRAVTAGRVDFAVIDAQSMRVFRTASPTPLAVRVIGATDCSPVQTFCTRTGEDPSIYFDAISEAIARLDDRHRARLGLRGIVRLGADAYDLPLPPPPEAWITRQTAPIGRACASGLSGAIPRPDRSVWP
jgi:hypothetical protein